MAGELNKAEAICLSIVPWSKTSHIVAWLTDTGKVSTVVKGAARPKSAFLGQYDLNYTCELLYYARAKGELHALRECVPLVFRETLREDFRKLALAGYYRFLVERLAPQGPDCAEWYQRLTEALDALLDVRVPLIRLLLAFELDILRLMGLDPEIEAAEGGFRLRGERAIPVSSAVADFLHHPLKNAVNDQIPLDAARVIGVFYQFHVDLPMESRRAVLQVISKTKQKG